MEVGKLLSIHINSVVRCFHEDREMTVNIRINFHLPRVGTSHMQAHLVKHCFRAILHRAPENAAVDTLEDVLVNVTKMDFASD